MCHSVISESILRYFSVLESILFYFVLPCMSFLVIAIASVKSSRLRGASSIVHIGMSGDKEKDEYLSSVPIFPFF